METNEILSLLYFNPEYRLKKKNNDINPKFELVMFCEDSDLTEEEIKFITFQINQCNLNVLIAFKDTFVVKNTPLKSFVASISKNCTFQPHIMSDLFHGISITAIVGNNPAREYTNKEKKNLIEKIKTLCPCKSTMPFQASDDVPENWEPSLGPGGYVMIGTRENTNKSGSREQCILVYTTVDENVYEEMQHVMQRLFEQQYTMEEGVGILKKYRDYVIENMERILFRISKHSGIALSGDIIRTESPIQQQNVSLYTEQKLKLLGLENIDQISCSFNIPCEQIEYQKYENDLSKLNFSDYHYRLKPELTILFSDITPDKDTESNFIIRSNCCEVGGQVVRLSGGASDLVSVFNTPEKCQSLKWLNSFPCIASGKLKKDHTPDDISYFSLGTKSRSWFPETHASFDCINQTSKEYTILPKITIF